MTQCSSNERAILDRDYIVTETIFTALCLQSHYSKRVKLPHL